MSYPIEKPCPACKITVVIVKTLPPPYVRCVGPEKGVECPLNRIIKAHEDNIARLEAAKKSSLFIG